MNQSVAVFLFLTFRANFERGLIILTTLSSLNLNLATVPNLAHLVSANSKCTSWLYAKKNSWIGFFRRYCIAFGAFSRNIDHSEIQKMGLKNKKKLGADFPVFVCGPFIPLVSTLGQSGPSFFWNMLKSNQGHDACKVLAQSPEPVRRNCTPAEDFARKILRARSPP